MPGRHISAPRRRRVPRRVRTAGALVLVLGTIAALVLGLRHGAEPNRAGAATPCAQRTTLHVLSSPAIAPAIQEIATDWESSPDASPWHGCLQVSVTSREDAAAEADLATGSAASAMLWVSDSSIWVQRLSSELTAAGAVGTLRLAGRVASSPLVVVEPSRTGSATSISLASLARSAGAGTAPISVPNPLTTAEGVLGLQLLGQATSATPGGSPRTLIGVMVALGQTVIDSPQAGFAAAAATGARPFFASEQELIAADRTAGHPVAAAGYPDAGDVALDFPAVELIRPGTDPQLSAAADAFGRVLDGVTAQRVFSAYGFRDPQAEPIAGTAAAATPVAELPLPTATRTADLLRLWSAAVEASHTLAVIDVSGSMADPAGDGRSKIQVAADAAAAAINYFPDSSAFGLWAFSSDLAGAQPWVETAPLLPLGAQTGGTNQRRRLEAAISRLPGLVGGDTALYDTALAAFEQVRNTYDPGKINSVVLLTDGMDVYPQGLSLSELLTRLRSLVDPVRPVPIITIGIGDQADVATLAQISAVTGGTSYVVHNPDDIRGVFLDAMLQRECRPDCASTQ